MAKIVAGVAMVAGAVALTVTTGGGGAWLGIALSHGTTISAGGVTAISMSLGTMGAAMTMEGIAGALASGGQGLSYSRREPASYRQVIYGQSRVGGTYLYLSSTGADDQQHVIAWAGHSCQSIDVLYCDSKEVHLNADGSAASGTYTDDAGNKYKFCGGGDNGPRIWAHHDALGSSAGHWYPFISQHGDSKWDATCTLKGICASYIMTRYNSDMFQGPPQFKAAIHGKNDIYDPRRGALNADGSVNPAYCAWTDNAALIVADFLTNKDFGFGIPWSQIDLAQLIAAANICDETVALAAGGSEKRYTINGTFDTSSTPGDILESLLMSMEGRLVYQHGLYKIFPAAWYGSTLQYDQSDLVSGIKWTPRRALRDLNNAVRGTYVSPPYPYAQSGYDRNHKNSNIFNGCYQPTDFPPYAQDALHGYTSDANLAADGGNRLYTDRRYQFVTSVATAQRLAKIFLMRNRQQGTGTLTMNLAGFATCPEDVIQMTFPTFGWTNKYLEVQSFRGVLQAGENQAPTLTAELTIAETDPSVYSWSTAEERTVTNTDSPALRDMWQVSTLGAFTLTSDSSTAVVGVDGVTTPRIHATWTQPDDPFVTTGGHIEVQYQLPGQGSWFSLGKIDGAITDCYIAGVVSGVTYNVQARAVRGNGATSDWVSASVTTGMARSAFHAGDMSYSNGATVDSLRPAQAGADVTGSNTAANTNYVGGSSATFIEGRSVLATGAFGQNLCDNPGFEIAPTAGSGDVAAGWYVQGAVGCSDWSAWQDNYNVHTGSYQLGMGLNIGSAPIPTGQSYQAIEMRRSIPVVPGQVYTLSLLARWDYNTSFPSNINGWFMGWVQIDYSDGSYDRFNTNQLSFGQDWTTLSCTFTVPNPSGKAVKYATVWLYQWIQNNSGSAWVRNNVTPMHIRVDNVSFVRQTNLDSEIQDGSTYKRLKYVSGDGTLYTSTVLNGQGSILPNQPITLTWSSNSNSCTVSWTAQSVLRADGSTLSIPAGSLTYSSLSPSTTYYTYWFIRVSDGTLQTANGSPPSTSPNTYTAMQCALDGRMAIGVLTVSTTSTSTIQPGSGTGGGGDKCPESAEPVDVYRRPAVDGEDPATIPASIDASEVSGTTITAGELKAGDYIRGRSFKSGKDVYRRVLQVSTETSVAWRIVDGHKVSPCEPVYYNDAWVAAYRVAGSTFDTSKGTKMLITVESDAYDESNYYLVGDTPLLIHNWSIIAC